MELSQKFLFAPAETEPTHQNPTEQSSDDPKLLKAELILSETFGGLFVENFNLLRMFRVARIIRRSTFLEKCWFPSQGLGRVNDFGLGGLGWGVRRLP